MGTVVTISGSGFSGATSVKFHGVAATTPVVLSDAQLTATVPAGATSGTVSVTTPGGTATSAASFTVITAPAISGFAPASGPVGTSVTISGSGFSDATSVKFNGVAATTPVVLSDAQLTATVPAGATSGTVSVTTPGGTATSAASFTVVITPTVTLTLSGLKSGAVKLGKRVTASGGVTPTSLTGSKFTLTAQLKHGTRWVKAMTFSALVASTGAYDSKFKPTKKGAYRLQATIAKTATHAAATTKWLTFKVK